MWVAAIPHSTVYASPNPDRAIRQAAKLLGEDYAGVMVRDGWARRSRRRHA